MLNVFKGKNNNESSLKEEQLFSMIVKKTQQSIIVADANGKIVWVNDGFTNLCGYTLDEIKGKKPGQFLRGKNTDPKTGKKITELLLQQIPFTETILNYDKFGTPYWVRIQFEPIFNEKNELIYYVAYEQDVSEEIIERQNSLALNDAINLGIGFVELGLDRKVLRINDKLANILGYSPNELIGQDHHNLVGDLYSDAEYQNFWNTILNNGKYEGQFKRLKKNGEVIWLQGIYILMRNPSTNEPQSIIKLAFDITEKKLQELEIKEKNEELLATEEELRMAQEELNAINEDLKAKSETLQKNLQELEKAQEKLKLLSLIASNSENAIAISNSDLKIEWVNPAFIKYSGYTLQEAENEHYLKLLNSTTDKNFSLKEFEEKIQLKTPFQTELKHFNKNGNVYWVNATVTPVLDLYGNIEKVIIVETDITEKKIKDQKLYERAQDLEDSLSYAKMIQRALLPDNQILACCLSDFFIYYQPKENIGGDFYWFHNFGNSLYVAVADCTGHGMPGALLATYFQQFLSTTFLVNYHTSIDNQLSILNQSIKKLQNEQGFKDAFELSLVIIQKDYVHVFTTTAQPVYLQKNNQQIEIIKSDNYLGINPLVQVQNPFQIFTYPISEIKRIFLCSDGIADQFGGPEHKKFSTQRLKSIFSANVDSSMKTLIKEIRFSISSWKHHLEQTDDQVLIGLEL